MNDETVEIADKQYDPQKPTRRKWKFYNKPGEKPGEKCSYIEIDEEESRNLNPDDIRNFFTFKVTLQITYDHRELIHISAECGKVGYRKEHGEIVTNISNLQNDICRFRNYGVMLPITDLIDIGKTIEDNYLEIQCIENIETEEKLIEKVFKEVICPYIKDMGIKSEKIGDIDLYNIPANDFKDFVLDNDIIQKNYLSSTQLRKELRKMNYTKCTPNRTDNTICVGEEKSVKRIKAISFFSDKVNEANKANAAKAKSDQKSNK